MRFDKRLWVAAFVLGMIFVAGSARASNPSYSGTGILVNNTCANTATQASFTACDLGGTPTVTFSASALDFSSFGNIGNTGTPGTDYTFASFLGSLGYVTGIPAYSNSLTGGTALNAAPGGSLFEFTGTALFTNGQTYTVAHDDGVTFEVNGVVVLGGADNVGGTSYGSGGCAVGDSHGDNACIDGPTSPVTNTYTYGGTTGTYSFNFVYGECCGAPAVFETTLVQAGSVPEPTSILLLGGVLLAVGKGLRRKLA